MKILSIETSCDETAVSIIEKDNNIKNQSFSILGNALISQAEKHAKYGGVFPNLAKREHAKNLVPLTLKAIGEAGILNKKDNKLSSEQNSYIEKLLEREPELLKQIISFLEDYEKPPIDFIAVTEGPGLEPALWVGINFAKVLSYIWNIPLVPINHMEGHIVSSLLNEETELGHVSFPALALLISGGHTELVLIKSWFEYQLIGSTRDDAVGEAFDKVARMLGLSYPGGPEISKLAQVARAKNIKSRFSFPRPMMNSDDCDFSFSGLKTAVLYTLQNVKSLTPEIKQEFAVEFEDAVIEILISKTKKAVIKHNIKTIIIGGGVSANKEIRKAFKSMVEKEFKDVLLYIPPKELSTDNAIMIGVAALLRIQNNKYKNKSEELRARGNLKLQ